MLRVVTTLAAIAFAAPVAVAAADPPPLTAPPPAPLEAPGTQKDPQPDQYIVELHAPPLARYSGGAKGLAPTAPSATRCVLRRSGQRSPAASSTRTGRRHGRGRRSSPIATPPSSAPWRGA